MRRANRKKGTGSVLYALRDRAFGSISSSAGVIAGWSAGLSRKYQPHKIAQPKLAIPRTTNEPRHATSTISQATRGGVTIFPTRAAECVIPCANARLPSGIHADIARVAVGKAETPTPSITRPNTIADMPPAKPMNTVAADQIAAHTVSVVRGPTRSLTQPLMI